MVITWSGLAYLSILMISYCTASSHELEFEHKRYAVLISVNSPSGTIARFKAESEEDEDVAYSMSETSYFSIDPIAGKLRLLKEAKVELNNTIHNIHAKTTSGKTASAKFAIILLPKYFGDQFSESARHKLATLLTSYRLKPGEDASPSFLSSFQRMLPKAAEEEALGQLDMEETIRIVKDEIEKHFKSLFNDNVKVLLHIRTKDLFSEEVLEKLELCKHSRVVGKCPDKLDYRTFDGTCNNLKYPEFGASDTAFIRLRPAEYHDLDKLNDPIGYPDQPDAHDVPSPFEITKNFINDEVAHSAPSKELTHAVMQFGQFLDHDLTLVGEVEKSEHCHNVKCDGSSSDFVPPCYPILPLKTGDSKCIEFVRSAAVCQKGKMQTRQQMNVITAFIDGSQIYGSDESSAGFLRNKSSDLGLLRTSEGVYGEMLPLDTSDPTAACSQFGGCFLAGDIRCNEQASLASFHTLFLREHNRIARELKLINYHWNGDKIYSETRKILGAVLQKIVYEDYLPLILGKHALYPYKGYDEEVNPGIANAFATGAYRFGHSTIQPKFQTVDENFKPIAPFAIDLIHMFFNNTIININGIAPLLIGLISNPSENVDRTLSSGLTGHLFERSNTRGLNLAALNIQRSRDHGLPGYNTFRKFCHLSDAKKFKDTKKEISEENIIILSETYNDDPDLAELWVAGLAETPVKDGIVGETFKCVIADQFERSRDGDRYFYEKENVFSKKQLKEIKKTSLSRIYCDNLYDLVFIQKNAFKIPGNGNKRMECKKLTAMDLNEWKDEVPEFDIYL